MSRDALIHANGLAERLDFRPCRQVCAFGGVGHQCYIFHPADPSLTSNFKLTAHAEKHLAHLRSTGNLANALYAEPFLAIFKHMRELW